MRRIIIAGGRDFSNWSQLEDACDTIVGIWQPSYVEIVSGGAKGADDMGETYALQHGIDVKCFPADWAGLGKRAGILRNIEMANYADVLIAFWDGKSKGTDHMIHMALDYGLEVHVYRYENE